MLVSTTRIKLLLHAIAFGAFALLGAAQARAAQPAVQLELTSGSLLIRQEGRALPVALNCPSFKIAGQSVGGAGTLPAPAPAADAAGRLAAGKAIELTYAPIALGQGETLNPVLHLQWSPEESMLRKWVTFKIEGVTGERVWEEVVFDEIDTAAAGLKPTERQTLFVDPMSYPVLLEGFFVGVEFPIARTRLDGARAIVASAPGKRLVAGTSYETRKAVYGVTPVGRERQSFKEYIQRHSVGELRRLFIWEPWITVHIPHDEADLLDHLGVYEEKLVKRHGVTLDSYIMTAGWSDPSTVWQIDRKRFPEGFANVSKAVARMNSRMGTWISPSSTYDFAQRANDLRDQGYETFKPSHLPYHVACVAGKKYGPKLKESLTELFKSQQMLFSYFDGYLFTCPESNHGHEPGPLSAETMAESIIDIFQSLRQAVPDVWLEAACFSGSASPWWLFHVNNVLGNYGADYAYGLVPAPVYRESYTTGRDFPYMQGLTHGLIPAAYQEIYAGLYNHTREPLVNDAVMGVMRGNMMYMFCMNPKVVDDYGWAAIADVITWARNNVEIFTHTEVLPPASWRGGKVPWYTNGARGPLDLMSEDAKPVSSATMPREVYGYAHWQPEHGLIALRNPWIAPQDYEVALSGLGEQAKGLAAVSIYPENRVYGRDLKRGDTLKVTLAPYETVVIDIAARKDLEVQALPIAAAPAPMPVKVTKQEVSRVEYTRTPGDRGPNWTDSVGTVTSALKLTMSAEVTLDAPAGELLILSEEEAEMVEPIYSVTINGKPAAVKLDGPELGYYVSAPGLVRLENWLFLRAPLEPGRNVVEVELLTRSQKPRLSAYAWAFKPGQVDGSKLENSLPQPEVVSLASAELLKPVVLSDPALPVVKMEPLVERIDGVYLDAMETATLKGVINKNLNANLKPMSIRGRRALRGLGTVAPAEFGYTLDGTMSRFVAQVGIDNETQPLDKTNAVFEVWVDGVRKWNSPQLTRWDDPVTADVDVRGARELKLVVVDRSAVGTLDCTRWVDWANARLLR